jgi:hypothetical protein
MINNSNIIPIIKDTDKNIILQNIKIKLEETILDDFNNYTNIIYFGHLENLQNSLDDIIFSELNSITNNEYTDWCSKFTFSLSKSIIVTLNSLYKCSKISVFSDIDLTDYIYEIIEYNINEI